MFQVKMGGAGGPLNSPLSLVNCGVWLLEGCLQICIKGFVVLPNLPQRSHLFNLTFFVIVTKNIIKYNIFIYKLDHSGPDHLPQHQSWGMASLTCLYILLYPLIYKCILTTTIPVTSLSTQLI